MLIAYNNVVQGCAVIFVWYAIASSGGISTHNFTLIIGGNIYYYNLTLLNNLILLMHKCVSSILILFKWS